ncbi:MAG: sulfur carrier protein ThiS [Solirubrobacterales bacterium]|nr:sulfur carrier protein ThiS [Solirubrobacterales bacterium]
MRVEINGNEHELAEGASIRDAAEAVGVQPGRGVAVALDGEVVPRGELEAVRLREGQRVEVVAAIGGGAPEGDGEAGVGANGAAGATASGRATAAAPDPTGRPRSARVRRLPTPTPSSSAGGPGDRG